MNLEELKRNLNNNENDNCNKMMSEIVEFISEHKDIENTYKKIKNNLDEAQLNKKKIEIHIIIFCEKGKNYLFFQNLSRICFKSF